MKRVKRSIHAVWHVIYYNVLFRLNYMSGNVALASGYWRYGPEKRICEMYYTLLRREDG